MRQYGKPVAVIGAGLAGCEAALVLSNYSIPVDLYEARPLYMSPAHKTSLPAELVCSNSFKSNRPPSAHALLKAEMHILESPLLEAAIATSIPAGTALAVDRRAFSLLVKKKIEQSPYISYITEEVEAPPKGYNYCIIAAGPLVSDKLSAWIQNAFSMSSLNFYDAIAPIIAADSIDRSIAFPSSRWEIDSDDYLNCPFDESQYRQFYEALREADRVEAREFEEKRFFEACLPIEVAAERGFMALAFGPLRPVGIIDPRTGRRPFAVCQLRLENVSRDSYNMVGFQTRLKIGEQQRVFRLIPGLANAEFLRYGSIHRNTYIDSPSLLRNDLSFRKLPHIFIAGQLCGSEGYTESIATGHLAALAVLARLKEKIWSPPPHETALGALLRYITSSEDRPFTPSNIHFGLFPPLENGSAKQRIDKRQRREMICGRAIDMLKKWVRSVFEIFS